MTHVEAMYAELGLEYKPEPLPDTQRKTICAYQWRKWNESFKFYPAYRALSTSQISDIRTAWMADVKALKFKPGTNWECKNLAVKQALITRANNAAN